MLTYEIIENKNNIKSKQRFYNDNNLNKLINILIKYTGSFKVHNFVRDLFYVKSTSEYVLF